MQKMGSNSTPFYFSISYYFKQFTDQLCLVYHIVNGQLILRHSISVFRIVFIHFANKFSQENNSVMELIDHLHPTGLLNPPFCLCICLPKISCSKMIAKLLDSKTCAWSFHNLCPAWISQVFLQKDLLNPYEFNSFIILSPLFKAGIANRVFTLPKLKRHLSYFKKLKHKVQGVNLLKGIY